MVMVTITCCFIRPLFTKSFNFYHFSFTFDFHGFYKIPFLLLRYRGSF
jgi:hypothetical protein